jgi:glutathione synthase/RimK-type ligase-like ATP-grasp enzyme
MLAMDAAGVLTVPWFQVSDIPRGFEFAQKQRIMDMRFPLLARKITGQGGTDIVPVFEAKEIPWRIAAGWDWFSSYIPMITEHRVWVFRGRALGTYEKQMRRPKDYKYIGRNFRNGFDFVKSDFVRDASEQAVKAVKALRLDFGAVDMLRGMDGRVYVLEVNTAPGCIKSGAQATLGKLADCIVDWEKSGYK